MNERVKDAVYHYVLSWRAGENPTDSQAFDAVSATLTALNMHDHQWIGAIHRNTGHVHTHVAVNRINPLTYRSVYPKLDWIALDQECRLLEVKHGWSQSPGPHSIEVGNDNIVHVMRTQREISEIAKSAPTARARDFAAWNGVGSFQEWVGGAPADALKRALQKSAVTWQDVHRSLKAFDLEYRTKGSGAVVVDRSAPDRLHAKASHLGRFASIGQLAARLGPYESAYVVPMERHIARDELTSTSAGSYGSCTEKCVPLSGPGQIERPALFVRYSAAKAAWEATEGRKRQFAWGQQRAGERKRTEALRVANRKARERIKALPANQNKRAMYSVQTFIAAARHDALQRQIQQERQQLRTERKSRDLGTWRDWLACQATAGDKVAMYTLRRIRYRQRAERRSQVPRIEFGSVTGGDDPRKPILAGLNWLADAQGVDYRIDRTTMFRDEGRRVVFREISDDAIRAGLMLCREKWSCGLCVSGTDEFKAKAITIAAAMLIYISEPALRRTPSDISANHSHGTSAAMREKTIDDLLELERLADVCKKPIVTVEPRAGRQHTGKVIIAESTGSGHGFLVIDVGRELAIMRTSADTAARMKSNVGRRIIARADKTRDSSGSFAWLFVDPNTIERELGRAQ